jgi:hypothetical protein
LAVSNLAIKVEIRDSGFANLVREDLGVKVEDRALGNPPTTLPNEFWQTEIGFTLSLNPHPFALNPGEERL